MNAAEHLCYRDPRSPWFETFYGDDEEKPEPRKDCFCDNCFSGNDKLALEIIRLQELVSLADGIVTAWNVPHYNKDEDRECTAIEAYRAERGTA